MLLFRRRRNACAHCCLAAGGALECAVHFCDDLNDRTSQSGDEVVRTSDLDAPARRRVRFDRANRQYPTGSPFRALLMSGTGPEAIGVMEAHAYLRTRMPNAVTLDVDPTLMELAALWRISKVSARGSARPLLGDPAAPWDRRAIGGGGVSARSERCRPTMWDEGRDGEELHNHDRDSRECKNPGERKTRRR